MDEYDDKATATTKQLNRAQHIHKLHKFHCIFYVYTRIYIKIYGLLAAYRVPIIWANLRFGISIQAKMIVLFSFIKVFWY